MDSRYEEFVVGKCSMSDQELLQAQAHIWNHTFSFINSMSLKCAIDLAIPDTIHNHGKPMTLSELVSKLPIHPSKNHQIPRVMRILSHSGFFALQKLGHEQEEGYVLTAPSRLLLKKNPLSLSPFVLAMLDPPLTSPFQHMSDWFKTDDATAFDTTHGATLWEYGARERRFGRLFDDAMASDARLVSSIVTGACREVFVELNMLIDVGGGTGTMARALAEAFPEMECRVFDVPHVVEGLEESGNLKFISGDMFEAIPPTNAIMLKWIMHDWCDEKCLEILKNCKEAILSNGGKGGKVIIIDMVVQNDMESHETQLFFDMLMMTLVSGRERSEEEWAKLFSCAGFSAYKVTPILGVRSLIELYP